MAPWADSPLEHGPKIVNFDIVGLDYSQVTVDIGTVTPHHQRTAPHFQSIPILYRHQGPETACLWTRISIRRRGQVAKAEDCKSFIAGSNPAGASSRVKCRIFGDHETNAKRQVKRE